MSDETDFSSELESQTSLDVDDCSEKIAEELKTVKNANSEFQKDLQGVDEKLEDLTERISRLSEAQEVSDTLTDLQKRVKEQNNKLNQFIQNVVTLKKLPQMVEDLRKRLKIIENL